MTEERLLTPEERVYFEELVRADVKKRVRSLWELRFLGLLVIFLLLVRAVIVLKYPEIYSSRASGLNPFENSSGLVIERLIILVAFSALYFSFIGRPQAKYISVAAMTAAAFLVWLDAEWILLTFDEEKSGLFYFALALRAICLVMLVWIHVKILRVEPPIFN